MSNYITTKWDIVIAGGGPAGFFAAIRCAELNPDLRVLILEKSTQTLWESYSSLAAGAAT
jgi:flavin-dependent dehydrogenase